MSIDRITLLINMKAVGMASRAVKAWAVTPSGALTCLRSGIPFISPVNFHDRISHRALHTSPITRLDAGPASSPSDITKHASLPVPPSKDVLKLPGASFRTVKSRRNRQKKIKVAMRTAGIAQKALLQKEGLLNAEAPVDTPTDVIAGGQERWTGYPAAAVSIGDDGPSWQELLVELKKAKTPLSSHLSAREPSDLIAVAQDIDGPTACVTSADAASATRQSLDQKREKRAAKLARRRERIRSRAKPVPTSAYPTGPKPEQVAEVEEEQVVRRDEPPHVGMTPKTLDTGYDALEVPRNETSIDEGRISASDISLQEMKPDRPMKIATLRSDLSRVLFSPGVHHLRDPRCGVRNFGESLDAIPKAEDFAAERTPTYVPPSQHQELLDLASKNKAKFIGSTSTLTKAFSQIWFTINGGRELDFTKFSQDFANANKTYTHGAELPAVLVLTPLQGQDANGDRVWAVDSDKAYDIENALSDYGRVLEKQLTAEDADFARFLRSAPDSAVSQEERNEAEAYRYRQAGSILMRSQLDCHDPRLPGTGVFDIKTRACHPLRHDRANVEQASGHDVYREKGMGNTFERELYDLVRSAMLKFSMQVRIGNMDGIFLAYHNTARMFGFQYLPLSDMDEYLFGSTELADQAFNLSISIFERIIQHVTSTIGGNEPISMMMYKTPRSSDPLNIYFGPASKNKPTHAIRLRTTNEMNGSKVKGPISFGDSPAGKQWTVNYAMSKMAFTDAQAGYNSCVNMLVAMCTLSVPSGKTVGQMIELSKIKEQHFDPCALSGSPSAAAAASAKGVVTGGEGIEDVLLEGEVFGANGTKTTTTTLEGESRAQGAAASGTSASAQDGANKSKVKVRWVAPNGRIQALRREVEASRELYEERTKGWTTQ